MSELRATTVLKFLAAKLTLKPFTASLTGLLRWVIQLCDQS